MFKPGQAVSTDVLGTSTRLLLVSDNAWTPTGLAYTKPAVIKNGHQVAAKVNEQLRV